MITHVSCVIRPKGSDLIFGHPPCRICAGVTPACRLAAAVQIGTFGIAWQRCPTYETGGAPPVSAANQDLSAAHPRHLVALVHLHRASLARGHPATATINRLNP